MDPAVSRHQSGILEAVRIGKQRLDFVFKPQIRRMSRTEGCGLFARDSLKVRFVVAQVGVRAGSEGMHEQSRFDNCFVD